ncbi:ankyrin repeat domain-containing protein [bacterium]|nr:MAG: ankyrin repeat domain-containing protein [bacterium]
MKKECSFLFALLGILLIGGGATAQAQPHTMNEIKAAQALVMLSQQSLFFYHNLNRSFMDNFVSQDPSKITETLRQAPRLITIRDTKGNTLLHRAIKLNTHPRVKQVLLECFANSYLINEESIFLAKTHFLALPNKKGKTALHAAIIKGSEDIVYELLMHGANPNAATYERGSFSYLTPLHTAIIFDRIEILNLLLQHPSTDIYAHACMNESVISAFSLASIYDRPYCLALLKNYFNKNNN